jgi:hypothetical protein
VPDFNVSKRGDFEPLITERIFFRVQAILDGRYEVTGPRQRNDPDFPLRGYVRCETCGKPLTASWEDYYNYHRPHGALDGQTPYERLLSKTRAQVSPTC